MRMAKQREKWAEHARQRVEHRREQDRDRKRKWREKEKEKKKEKEKEKKEVGKEEVGGLISCEQDGLLFIFMTVHRHQVISVFCPKLWSPVYVFAREGIHHQTHSR
jgi:Ni/Co efflux regulator RcnB